MLRGSSGASHHPPGCTCYPRPHSGHQRHSPGEQDAQEQTEYATESASKDGLTLGEGWLLMPPSSGLCADRALLRLSSGSPVSPGLSQHYPLDLSEETDTVAGASPRDLGPFIDLVLIPPLPTLKC